MSAIAVNILIVLGLVVAVAFTAAVVVIAGAVMYVAIRGARAVRK